MRVILFGAAIAVVVGLAATPVRMPVVHAVDVGCDVDSLKQAIISTNNLAGADTLTLPVNCVYTLDTTDNEGVFGNNGLPVITDDLVIEGNGATIERAAGNEIPVFRLIESQGSESELTLRNLTLRNGCASTTDTALGGAVKAQGTLLIENVTITDNIAVSTFIANGGAIAGVNITINNSTLSGNRSSGPGTSSGGAIHATALLTLNNATLDDNRALSSGGLASGGAISTLTATVTNSTLTNNAAIGSAATAGAISVVDGITVTGSTISNNNATGTFSAGQAGAIYSNNTLTVLNTTIANNSAAGTTHSIGGGIYSQGDMTITRSTISDNASTGAGTSAEGGGAYATGAMTIVNSTISGNSAAGMGNLAGSSLGGGVLSVTDLDISNSTFSGNFVTGLSPRGGSFFAINPGTIENSIFASGFPENCDAFNSGEIIADATNLSTDDSCDDATVEADAGLAALALTYPGTTKTHALEPDSPGRGLGNGCEAEDQRGVQRASPNCDAGAFEFEFPEPSQFDVNCDGEVTAVDALAVMRVVANFSSGFQPVPPCDGDVDGDEDVDIDDVLLLRRYLANLLI